MKTKITILAVALIALLAVSTMPFTVLAPATVGPRIDEVLVKIYGSDTALYTAMEASEIDIMDWPLTSTEVTKWSQAPYNATIALDAFREMGMYEFDINNNETMLVYPNWRSPTSYTEFRRAIAHLVDKPFIVSNIVGGYGAILETPIMPWLRWYDPTIPVISYDPNAAAQILYDNGWRDTNVPEDGSKVHFPPGHALAGTDLETVMTNGPHAGADPGLIFYRRSDHSLRNLAGQLLIYGDATHVGLESGPAGAGGRGIGIPVDDNSVPSGTSFPKVMVEGNFHIYTGGWSLGRDPDHLYWLYHSDMYNPDPTSFSWNYDNVHDALFDTYAEGLLYARTLEEAEDFAHLACQRWASQQFMIPLWTTAGYMAHKKDWHVLNVESYGIADFWNIYSMNNPSIGTTGGTMRYGFMQDVKALNPIFSEWVWDWQILELIYDGPIAANPMNIAVDMPWMASSWTVGTWTNPDNGETASKISFTFRTGMKWVNTTNGAVLGDVTTDDIVFSYQYVYDQVGWNYPAVADLYVNPDGSLKIEVVGNTVTFYETVQSVWALHWLNLPIIPKFIYETIPDATGFTPGNLGAEATLVGSGAFYFVSYTSGVSALLRANRNYWAPIVPNIDTDPTNIKIDWGIFKANPKDMDWTVNVLDLIIVAGALGWTGPPGDIPSDINKDGAVNVLDLIVIAVNLGASWF